MGFYRQIVRRACVRSSGGEEASPERTGGVGFGPRGSSGGRWLCQQSAQRCFVFLLPPLLGALGSGAAASGRSRGEGFGVSSGWVVLPVTPSPAPCAPSSLHLTLVSPSSPLRLLQLVPKLSRNYLKEGYMEKTGPKVGLKHFCNPCKHESRSVRG